MEFGFLLAYAGTSLAVIGGIVAMVLAMRVRPESERALAESAGLVVTKASKWRGVEARHGSLAITLDGRSDSGGTRVTIRPIASGLSAWRVVDQQTRSTGVESGDASLDASVRFSGPALLVGALLDARTREVARDAFLVDSSVAVRDGALVVHFGSQWGAGQPLSRDRLSRLLALAERLQEPADAVPRLAAIAREDREPGVRRNAVVNLTQRAETRPETRQAQRTACADDDPGVRLAGARAIGAEGVPVLEELATKRGAPDDVAAAAIGILRGRLSFSVLRTILEHAGTGRPLTARAVLATLGEGGAEQVDAIAAALARAGSGPVALAAVHALTAIRTPSAARPLAAALTSDAETALAAAQGLALAGTVESVPALRAAERRPQVRRAAREAIVAIQSRLTGASPGQLALAPGADGRLSVADVHGSLTLTPRGGKGDDAS